MREVSTGDAQRSIEEQVGRVIAAENALRRAEGAVAQAQTPSAVMQAHRRADAALLEVELAETVLARLRKQVEAPPGNSTRRVDSDAVRRSGQQLLFDAS